MSCIHRPSPNPEPLTRAFPDPRDLAQLAERGISPAEAERQLEVMGRPAARAARMFKDLLAARDLPGALEPAVVRATAG
ncbi:MAG: hypothetical protein ACKOC6_00490, partial [bacterium]